MDLGMSIPLLSQSLMVTLNASRRYVLGFRRRSGCVLIWCPVGRDIGLSLSGALTPPTSNEAPTISLPPNMILVSSEEDYLGWKTIYRGSISTTWADRHTLEDAMPMWLLDYLLTNKVPALPIVTISLFCCHAPMILTRYPSFSIREFCFAVQTPVTVTDLRAGPNPNSWSAGS